MIAYTPPSLPPSPAAVVRAVAVGEALNFENARKLVQASTAEAEAIAARGTGDPIVDTWRMLPKPSEAELAPLVAEVSDLNVDLVRRVDWEVCQLLIEGAVKSGSTMVDFITSPALRGPIIFYVPAPALNKAYAHYSGLFLTKPFGEDLKKKSFLMHGVLIGNGRVDVVYDRDGVSYYDKEMKKHFTVSRYMSVKILSAGELAFSGLATRVSLKLFVISPIIERMIKIGLRSVRVETNRGGQDVDIALIAPRPVPLPIP